MFTQLYKFLIDNSKITILYYRDIEAAESVVKRSVLFNDDISC